MRGLKIWKRPALPPKVYGFLPDIVSKWQLPFSLKLHLEVLQLTIFGQGLLLNNDNSLFKVSLNSPNVILGSISSLAEK